ncbi:MAG: hypothetical protein CENE_02552 [Candidatus Celerinatantimonas neptuna]|nr:MAG: hypothetical protein CENE_02552 [Candidatus Celerinatantimonas neptuna]
MDFSEIKTRQKRSFTEQKQLIKKALAGKIVLCPQCHQRIGIQQLPGILKLQCQKGCTDLELTVDI